MFEIELFVCIKMDLALNNLQWLICHKAKLNQTITSNHNEYLPQLEFLRSHNIGAANWHVSKILQNF